MTWLSEDPTVLATVLLILAGALFIALRVTQRGKYLIYAGASLALALVVVVGEWLWVTDNERIEHVVYDLRSAVQNSDVDGVLGHMSPHVYYSNGDLRLSGEATRGFIRSNLSDSHFDFVRVSGLRASAGSQSRRGIAEFRVFARGRLKTAMGTVDGGSAGTDWSLGFEETAPGIWKVCRITPITIPNGTLTDPGIPLPDGPRGGRFRQVGLNRLGADELPGALPRGGREGMPGRSSIRPQAN
jgi:hypothetical protein